MCLICILCEVDEEFLFYDILCRFFSYRLKKAYKTTNVCYFDEAYEDSVLWEKNISLSYVVWGVGGRRVIVGKY